MELTRNLKKINKDDAHISGGKGASLGEMTQAGIPVPPGFVILSSAFELFLMETDLIQEVEAALDKVDHKKIHTVEGASEKIRELILNMEMPDNIEKEIIKEFKKLGARYVAVRSSATVEDGQEDAWAGQLDSFLNTEKDKLLENIKKCWASLFTPRAIFYRFEKGLRSAKISVAVVVQKMVESKMSGIAFSVHPVTEDRNQLIIEAGLGLGEAIISGQVTPDSYVIEKEPRQILDVNINTQTKGLYRAKNGGNEWRDISEPKASSQVLSRKQILDLSGIILLIENHCGFPCDIEWVFKRNKFYIVQTRPITTLNRSRGISNIPKINSVEFWTREKSMPLFWLMDKKHNFGASTLIFYRKKMFHIYYLNDSQKQNEKIGYEFFSKKENVYLYMKEADKIIKDTMETFNKYSGYDFKKIKSEKLIILFNIFQKKLINFSDLYRMTEASNTEQLKKTKLDFNKLGEIRLELRKNFSNLFFIFIGKLLNEIARRNKLNIKKDIFFYNFNEMVNLINKGERVVQGKLKKRRSGFAVLREIASSRFFLGKDVDLMWERVDDLMIPKNKNEIKGSSVFNGQIKGKAKIIFQKRNKRVSESGYGIKKGNILVTNMTKPDMMIACKKAAAIVTDEGGILCHAAIISRELKKPCIVGTKIATQIIKDGDLVEVDADHGIIKILNKKR